MRILYLSASYVPSRRASSIQVMKMCAAFADLGHQVTLVTKASGARQEDGVSDDHAFYGVRNSFEIHKLPRPALRGGGLVFLLAVHQFLAEKGNRPDMVYARDLTAAILAAQRGFPLFFEAHEVPRGVLARTLFNRLLATPELRRLVVISEALKTALQVSLPSIAELRSVVVAHDAADAPGKTLDSTIEEESFPSSSKGLDVGYVGNLYQGRGINLLIELAHKCPNDLFHIVGGSARDLEHWRRRNNADNLLFHGFVPPSELTRFYSAFDVLVMPYGRRVLGASGKTNIGEFLSPMKLFEYMAAGKPIVSSSLPVFQEVLTHRENALLVDPEDSEGWVAALRELADNRELGRRIADNALEDFRSKYTWSARAAGVLDI